MGIYVVYIEKCQSPKGINTEEKGYIEIARMVIMGTTRREKQNSDALRD